MKDAKRCGKSKTLIAMIFALGLFSPALMAGCFEPGSPADRFLLPDRNLPQGVWHCTIDAELRAEGFESNPGQADEKNLRWFNDDYLRPFSAEEAWYQFLAFEPGSPCSDVDLRNDYELILIVLLNWRTDGDREAARGSVEEKGMCKYGRGLHFGQWGIGYFTTVSIDYDWQEARWGPNGDKILEVWDTLKNQNRQFREVC